MTIRAVLFDKDGTFVDFNATWCPALESVMIEMAGGDKEVFARLVDVNHYDLEARAMRKTSPFIAQSSADFAASWAKVLNVEPTSTFHSRMDALLDAAALTHARPIGDPAAVFDAVKQAGFALGIVTNDTETSARAQCEKLGLSGYLDAVIGYDSGFGRKPDPGPILAFGERFGFAPAEIAMVGDSTHDLHAARRAGAIAIGVLTGFATREELEPLADHVIDSIADLPGLLNGGGI
jgi:phosphoglycolate phosphatase